MKLKESSKTRVLIPLYYYHPYTSGVSVYVKRVAEGLIDEGYQVTVLTSRFDKKLPKREIINGVEVLRRPVLFKLNKGIIMPTFWLDIVRLGNNHNYVCPNLPLAESGISSLFIPKHKLISVYHCDLNLGKELFNRIITEASLAVMKLQLFRSRVVVVSTIDYLKHSRMKKFAFKAVAIKPMVTIDEFEPVESESFYRRLGVSGQVKKIGFVGRIVYEKGINYLLESIPYLEGNIPDFKIIIAGDYKKVAGGSTKDQLEKYIKKYPNKIIFTGFLSDTERNQFYSGLDVFVLPSIDPLEAYGMVQIEAMLCGAPVVASNLPGVRQIVKKTGYGRISKIKNPKDIATQIIEVLVKPHKYKPNRKEVAQIFSSKDVIAAYEELMPKH